MFRNRDFALLLSTSALWAACATSDDSARLDQDSADRDQAAQVLQDKAGAPVQVDVDDVGVTRVVAMTPRFHIATHVGDPAAAAAAFLAEHHDVFQLTAEQAANVKVTRVDTDPDGQTTHVTLQRVWRGIPIFQGAVTVHLNATGVFRALGDPSLRAPAPINRQVLTPTEAAAAAGKLLGLGDLQLSVASADADRTVLASPRTLDPIHVTPQLVQVSATESRLAYQATVSWTGADKQLQMQLVLIDQEDGHLIEQHNLVADFTGKVFTASPGANPQGDPRTVVSFDGDPTASPQGWVGSARKTIGNNAVAATDLNANNAVGTNEIQPTADASDSFTFNYSAQTDAASLREAAVTNAFYLVNQYHDLTYKLGFTETAGNFQTTNFGLGGAQNDEVQVDAQDGSSTNNANFGTPPDGQKPRMQMFLFNIAHGTALRQDGDFDPSVIWHENTHGLSNRLVGGGTTTCLNNLQSGGMGEGWGDFLGGSFLGNPIVGAYVTGNSFSGIRSAPMNASPLRYSDIKTGVLAEVHDAGELWASTLWSLREAVGKDTAEQLVVSGLKLTPCRPSMVAARDAIIQADANLNAGANRCAIFGAFASKGLGVGAASPSDTSTTQITTSIALPVDCPDLTLPGVDHTFAVATGLPVNIPDNNATGIRVNLPVTTPDLAIQRVKVSANITHTFRGDLIVEVVAPNGEIAIVSNQLGAAIDNVVVTDLDITGAFTPGALATGTWQLFVRDIAAADTGRVNSFSLVINSPVIAPPQ